MPIGLLALALIIMTLDLVALTKPRITLMTLLVAGGCMMLAEARLAFSDAALALLGIALLVSGSSAFNMYIEREHDKHMERTRNRPLPSGRLKPGLALWVGFLTSILAIPALVSSTNWLTAWLGFGSLLAYVLIYTPMKRWSTWALVVGAVPGAMPALMGYTAVSGKIDSTGLALFGLAFFWQLPHFIAIGIFRKDEYTRAGFPVIAQVTGEPAAILLSVFTTVLIVLNAGLLWWLEIGGVFYGCVSTLLGIWFLVIAGLGFFSADTKIWARKLFMASLVYQAVLFVALAVDGLLCKLL